MISPTLQPQIVEKIVRKNGRLFSVRAALIEIDGKPYVRVLSATPIQTIGDASKQKSKKAYALPEIRTKAQSEAFAYKIGETVSPFFSNLDFFISQMTRAPARQ